MWLNEQKIGYCICRIGITKNIRIIYGKNKTIMMIRKVTTGMFHGRIDLDISIKSHERKAMLINMSFG